MDKEIKDVFVTKLFSLMAVLYLLIMNLLRGKEFPYELPLKLYRVFSEEVITFKLNYLYLLMLAVPAIAIAMILISIIMSLAARGKKEVKAAAVLYEISGCAMSLIASAIYFEAFNEECALKTTGGTVYTFVLANCWFLFVFCYKLNMLIKSKTKAKIPLLIPGVLITAAYIAVLVWILKPVYSVVSGFDNYQNDLKKIDIRFETEGMNSLSSGVTIDGCIYAVSDSQLTEDDQTSKLLKIDAAGNVECLDDQSVMQRTVAKYGDTVFYSKYFSEEEYGFVIGSLNVKNGSQDSFNAEQVSADRKYLFGKNTTLLGVRGDHLYIYEGQNGEIWRMLISGGTMDRQSLELYAWNVSKNPHNVCYSNLDECNNLNDIWPWNSGSFEIGTDVYLFSDSVVPGAALDTELRTSEVNLKEIWVRPIEAVSGGKSVTKVIAANVFHNEIYYAVIENDKLAVYKTDLELNEPQLLDRYEIDVTSVYRQADKCRIVVSDSYLVFFTADDFVITKF